MPPTAIQFADFDIDPRIIATVQGLGFEEPTPIQAQAIPDLLRGHDIIGRARTGSGKTAAFGLPLLERVKDGSAGVQALVLTPTRELAVQVADALRSYASKLPVRMVTVYGGVAYGPQLAALRKGVSVVVGTPGRVLDHIRKGTLNISALEMLVLDEADEMLRMGFIDDVEEVLSQCPVDRQIALFSATLPPPIRTIANKYLNGPIEVQVEQRAHTTKHITQRWLVVPQAHKLDALSRVLAEQPHGATLIFARTRAGCAETATALSARGFAVDALHGDLNQSARELVLNRLRSGRLDTVVATDVAARGLDVEHLNHVVNLDLPTELESYVHRIGRTGRAGRAGLATSLVTPAERSRLGRFARMLDTPLVEVDVPSDLDVARRQQSFLLEDVERLLSSPASGPVSHLADRLLQNASPHAAVSALIGVLAELRSVPVNTHASSQPPAWVRKSGPAPKTGSGYQGKRAEFGKGKPSRGKRPGEPLGPGPRKRPFEQERRDGPKRTNKRSASAAEGHGEDTRFDSGHATAAVAVAVKAAAVSDVGDSRPKRKGKPAPGKPRPGKPRPRKAAPSEAAPGAPSAEFELFLAMGSRRGVRPQDVVGALAGDLGIPGNVIGRISVAESHTLVCVPTDVGKVLVEGDASVQLRGQWVSVMKARARR